MKVGNNKQLLIALGAAVVAAGSVSAQSSAGGFDKPLKSGATSAAPATVMPGSSVTFMKQDDGDNQYEIMMQDGKVTAKLNGKPVPQDRIVQEKGWVKILDENGKTVNKFEMSQSTTGVYGVGRAQPATPAPKARSGGGIRVAPAQPTPAEPPEVVMPDWEPPKVMLGINMSEPGEGLRKFHNLKPGESILIDRVIEGLPAEKAGIRENDLITEIEGKSPATPETLRDVLKEKDPGDTVTFTVLRKGGDQTIRVKLVKYDAEKLGKANSTPMPQAGHLEHNKEWQDQGNRARQEAENYMKGFQGNKLLTLPDGTGQAFVIGGPANEKVDAKLAELDKKLAELDKKMARLDELFAKLQEQLEKLPRDR